MAAGYDTTLFCDGRRRERRSRGNALATTSIEWAIASSARPFWSRLRRLDPKIALDERQIPLLAKRLHFFFLLLFSLTST
jgi:hypothetical protein